MPEPQPTNQLDVPIRYRIEIEGKLNQSWADWFKADSLEVSSTDPACPVTILVVRVFDQAGLYGWLARLRDLGLPLLSVRFLGKCVEVNGASGLNSMKLGTPRRAKL